MDAWTSGFFIGAAFKREISYASCGPFHLRLDPGVVPCGNICFGSVCCYGHAHPCHDAIEIAKQLSKKYEEAPIAFGLQSNGNLLQIYTSESKHTWTVVSTTPSGKSCIVAAGKRWETMPFVNHDPMA